MLQLGHHINEALLSRLAGLRRDTASHPGAPNQIVRNAGEGNGLEACRRVHGEYDLTSSMRRVAILQQVQNPPRCQRVEDLGSALEGWLSKKRQYEMFTDRNGRPCQASDDNLVAGMFRLMPKNLEETVMFTNEDESFQELFDRLLACSSTKQSVKMSESKRHTRRDDPMDVDALSKGKSKGKGKKGPVGSGKGNKGQNQMNTSSAGTAASLDTVPVTAERNGQEIKEAERAKEVKERLAS